MNSNSYLIFWFRRDLRLQDNAGLFHALSSGAKVLPVFIFDTAILDRLTNPADKRVNFIYREIEALKEQIRAFGSDLLLLYDTPAMAFKWLLANFSIHAVFCNEDYEPYGIQRDTEIMQLLANHSVSFNTYTDHVIFSPRKVCKDDKQPYTVFTPYAKKWKAMLEKEAPAEYPTQSYFTNFQKDHTFEMPVMASLGFQPSVATFPSKKLDEKMLQAYSKHRDFPSLDASSHISVHLRFGTISIRHAVRMAIIHSEVWLNELIWREFFMQILYHYPAVVNSSFKPRYDHIPWLNDEVTFEKWCRGETGYPIVDAGMRELRETGFMHNRVRMIVAGFLCKHLLIDWRWGEAWFAENLLDFELSSNNGNWQWAAGSGCDAAPYFRVFNPALQTQRFDPQHAYIKRWVPEYNHSEYPKPLVDHVFARERCLKVYKSALNNIL
jgi:deoxyribodipyrimidine photo-lyase